MGQPLSLDVILNTIDQASGPLKQIDRSTGKTAKRFKAAREELKKLQGRQKDLTSFRKLQRASKDIRNEFAAATERSKQLKRQMDATEEPTKSLTREFERAQNAVRKLRSQHINHLQSLRQTREQLQQAGINTENLSDEQRRLTRNIEASNRALARHQDELAAAQRRQEALTRARQRFQQTQQLAGSVAARGAGMIAAGGSATYGIAGIARQGINFDEMMSKVQALTRLEKKSAELAELRQQARELGATTSFSATAAAEGQGFLAMAGFDPKEIKDAMPGMLDLAKAAGQELGETADVASNILSGFGLEAAEMSRVGDVLSSTFTNSNTDLAMLGETMKYIAPVAKDLGITLEQAGAMSGVLGDIGVQSSMGGTALRSIYSRLASGPVMARKAIAEIGLVTKDEHDNMRPIVDLIKELDEKTRDMGNTKRIGLFKAIAGAEAFTALSGLTEASRTGKLGQIIQSNIKSSENSYAKGVSNVMGDNAAGDIQSLISALQDVAIEITSLNDGPMRTLIKSARDVVRGVGDWIRANPELAATIAKVATVGSGLLLVLGATALAVSGLMLPFSLLRFSLSSVGLTGTRTTGLIKKLGRGFMWLGSKVLPFVKNAIFAIGRALLFNPIGLAITAIAGGAYLIYRNWEGIKAWATATWDAVGNAFSAGWEWIKNNAGRFIPGVMIYENWDSIANWFSTKWAEVSSAFSSAIAQLSTTLEAWSPFKVIYDVIISALKQLTVELPKKFKEFGSMLITGLISGIKGKAAALKKSVTDVGSNVSGWFKKKLGINSPSRVFISHGTDVMRGLEVGLGNNGKTLKPLQQLTEKLKQGGAGLSISPPGKPAVAIDNRPPLSALASQHPSPSLVIEKIEVHAAPGMDEQALARLVAQEIRRHEQRAQSRARSSLSDYD